MAPGSAPAWIAAFAAVTKGVTAPIITSPAEAGVCAHRRAASHGWPFPFDFPQGERTAVLEANVGSRFRGNDGMGREEGIGDGNRGDT